jgi:hypothetical protein
MYPGASVSTVKEKLFILNAAKFETKPKATYKIISTTK